jgi:hypothetical protein
MMGELVVLGWLALELTDSPFLVGVAMGSRMIPLFFIGIPAGVLADRVPRQRLLLATGAGQAVTAGLIGAMTLLGVVSFTALVLLTFVAGSIRAVEHAARQSYTHDVAGAAQLVNGFVLLGVAMRGGWLVGSLGAGAVIAQLGSGAAYLAVAVAFLAGGLPLVRASAAAVAPRGVTGTVWEGIVGFATALRSGGVLFALMFLTAAAEIFGFSHQTLLPSLARDVLRVGPEGLGILNAARAVGGILGLFAVSARAPARRDGGIFLAAVAGFGVSVVVLGAAPHVVGFAGVVAVVIVVNAVGALADLFAQSLTQLSVDGEHRGRAGGAWVAAIGLAPLGQLQIGALASLFGVSIALGTSGIALLTLTLAGALAFPLVRRL